MADDRGKNWTFNTFFHRFRRRQFSKHLQLQQKWTNVRVLRKNNKGILTAVSKNTGAFAKQCTRSFNNLQMIIYKIKVKQYLLDKALEKHFTE